MLESVTPTFDKLHARSVAAEQLARLRTRLHDALTSSEPWVRRIVDRLDASGSAEVTAYRNVDGSYTLNVDVIATERRECDKITSKELAHVLDFAEDVLMRCRIV